VVESEAIGAAGGDLLRVLREAHEAGLSEVAARIASVLIAERTSHPGEAPAGLLRLAYPLDYVVRLEDVARGAEIDPLFLAALVRQESFWDPEAVSIAGAVGLTQVMPATGEAIAATIGPDPWTPADLRLPGVSLAFGAYYLGAQIERYGSEYVALAAYNAGPANAGDWEAATAGGSLAEFVEVIDIGETKHYVEQVLSHYAYYRLLYR
jgi:soluble lytic murein transglycosylase